MRLNSTIYPVLAAMALALPLGSGREQACRHASPADALRQRLERVQQDGKTIFGHDDDTAYGQNWFGFGQGCSDVLSVTGDYPGLMNWDLGMMELDSAANLDGVDFAGMSREIGRQQMRGGVTALSWHPRNPVSMGDSWNTEGGDVVALSLQPGTEANQRLTSWIGKVADWIGSLRDEKGRKVAVIFRPWHEHTGSWFWWGKNHTSVQNYVDLWKLTRQIFDSKGIDNVLWAYSPDKAENAEDYMERYPGDDYIDILGADVYHLGGEADTQRFYDLITSSLTVAREEAGKRGKLWALTETGNEGLVVPDWYTAVLTPALKDFKPLYVCVWRNAIQQNHPQARKGHFYTPVAGQPQEKSFVEYYRYPHTLFARDMEKY